MREVVILTISNYQIHVSQVGEDSVNLEIYTAEYDEDTNKTTLIEEADLYLEKLEARRLGEALSEISYRRKKRK